MTYEPYNQVTKNLIVGGRYNNAVSPIPSLNGSMDEVRVYERALSLSEIETLYNQRVESIDSYVSQKDVQIDNGNVNITSGNLTIQGTGININSLDGITGNYTDGNCWTYYTGGIATSTNCTA